MKSALYIIGLVVVFFLGQYLATPNVVEVERVEYDTIVQREVIADTIEQVRVVYRYLPSVSIVRTDTVVVYDTVLVEVPISRYTFADSLYRCEVEGYDVELKSMEVYPKTSYRTQVESSHQRWEFNAQVGYGFSMSGLSSHVGLQAEYNFAPSAQGKPSRLAVSVQGGYETTKDGFSPFAEMELSWKILSF